MSLPQPPDPDPAHLRPVEPVEGERVSSYVLVPDAFLGPGELKRLVARLVDTLATSGSGPLSWAGARLAITRDDDWAGTLRIELSVPVLT